MTRKQFIELHSQLSISIEKTIENNPIESATDPTQDIPVRNIECTAQGIPTNVKELRRAFSNIKVENFTTIEKRHNDQFDQLGELQESVSQFKGKDVTTNFVKPKKQKQNHEE